MVLIMGSGREAHDDVVSLLAAKDAEIAALVARVTELEGLVAALHAQLGRDSSNSGKPPSSDSPFIKKPAAKRSVRTRSGKPWSVPDFIDTDLGCQVGEFPES